jgi:hypothetical protein
VVLVSDILKEIETVAQYRFHNDEIGPLFPDHRHNLSPITDRENIVSFFFQLIGIKHPDRFVIVHNKDFVHHDLHCHNEIVLRGSILPSRIEAISWMKSSSRFAIHDVYRKTTSDWISGYYLWKDSRLSMSIYLRCRTQPFL